MKHTTGFICSVLLLASMVPAQETKKIPIPPELLPKAQQMLKVVNGIVYPETRNQSLALVRTINESLEDLHLSQSDALIFDELNTLGIYAEHYAVNRTPDNLRDYNACLNQVKAMIYLGEAYLFSPCDVRTISHSKGEASGEYPPYKLRNQPETPEYRISPDVIDASNAMLLRIRQVFYPKTHDQAVSELDQVAAAIKTKEGLRKADAAMLQDMVKLYTFATYMYDTREHWKTTSGNLLSIDPYNHCEIHVRGELATSVANSTSDCDLSVIGE
jgi:hypothetical protein